MHPTHAKGSAIKKILLLEIIIIIIIINYYLPGIVHQAVLPSTHISLTGVSIPHLNPKVFTVLYWLFSFSLFERPVVHIIFQGCLLVLRSHNLGSFSTLQKGSVFL